MATPWAKVPVFPMHQCIAMSRPCPQPNPMITIWSSCRLPKSLYNATHIFSLMLIIPPCLQSLALQLHRLYILYSFILTMHHSQYCPFACCDHHVSQLLSHGQAYLSEATGAFILHNKGTHFPNPSDHTPPPSQASAKPLPEITSGSYLVLSGKMPSDCNQCNSTSTQDTHMKNHSFQPLTPLKQVPCPWG